MAWAIMDNTAVHYAVIDTLHKEDTKKADVKWKVWRKEKVW